VHVHRPTRISNTTEGDISACIYNYSFAPLKSGKVHMKVVGIADHTRDSIQCGISNISNNSFRLSTIWPSCVVRVCVCVCVCSSSFQASVGYRPRRIHYSSLSSVTVAVLLTYSTWYECWISLAVTNLHQFSIDAAKRLAQTG